MKIIIFALGTRGDIEPFLAIGQMLNKKGHEVTCVFPEQFRQHTLESNLKFSTFGSEFTEMVRSPESTRIMGGNASLIIKLIQYFRFYTKHTAIRTKLLQVQLDMVNKMAPDRIIHSGLALYPFIWELQNKYKTTLLLPVAYLIYPVKDYAHLLLKKNWGQTIYLLSYKIMNLFIAFGIKKSAKILQTPLPISTTKLARSLLSHKTVFTLSPLLFPQPDYWNKTGKVLGFQQRDQSMNWTPPRKLDHFIRQHEKLLFITFGSMTSPFPKKNTQIILNTLEQNDIPAIINTSSGGLVRPTDYDSSLFYFVSEIPYDWIMPKIYGVVHHGGSGTTHIGLKYGCATLVIPHSFDQYTCNDIITRMGLGPAGIKISKISKKNLEPKILELFNNPSYKEKAEELSHQMKLEDYQEELCDFIVNDKL